MIIMQPSSNREMKKSATRSAIYHAALTLFIKHGYEKTTLSDIASAAAVSQRTIFAYFPSKEAIIFYPDQCLIDDLLMRVAERGTATVFETVKLFLHANHQVINDTSSSTHRSKQALILANPVLERHFSGMLAHIEQVLAAAISAERDLAADSLQARMIAAICRAAIHYQLEDNSHELTDERFDIITRFIEAGVSATRT